MDKIFLHSYHVTFRAAIKKIIEAGITSKEFQTGNAGHMTWVVRGVLQLAMEEQIKDGREKIDRPGLQRILGRFERPLSEILKKPDSVNAVL